MPPTLPVSGEAPSTFTLEMKFPLAVLLSAFGLSGCGDTGQGSPDDPADLGSANQILASSELPTIPTDAKAEVYSWSLMAAGVFARFEYSAVFMDKIEEELTAFNEADPLPKEIGRLGIPETPWFTPTTIQNGSYLIKELSDDNETPEEFFLIVDAAKTTIYLAYSWN
ncbi:MAG: hypothetical protein AAGA58_07585 [Verrucomicrobiota bacterium]